VLIEIFGPDDAFIVPAVTLDMPSLLTARMLEDGRILMWPAAAFRARVRSNGALAYGAMLQLSGYWRKLISQIKDLKLLSATERLSALLLALASRGAGPIWVPATAVSSQACSASLRKACRAPSPPCDRSGSAAADEKLPLPTRPGCVNSPTPVR
jgi:hypothetical protein